MQQIIISGRVSTAPQQFTRSDGTKYIAFYVSCPNGNSQTEKYSHYRCVFDIAELKDGDQVFIEGTLKTGIRKDKNGEYFVDLLVIVEHLTIGKRA